MDEPRIIALAGGSGSGKSVLASAIAENAFAGSSLLIHEDDYYCDFSKLKDFDPAEFNFDQISAFDHDYLSSNLRLLKSRQNIYAPKYDFKSHSRSSIKEVQYPTRVIVLEGINILNSRDIRNNVDFSVYLDVPDDIRLIRRILRDVSDRGRSLDFVLHQYLRTVRPMHLLYVEPSKMFADLVLVPEVTSDADADIMASAQIVVDAFQKRTKAGGI